MLLNRLRITDQIAVYEAQVFLSREDNQPITNFTAAVEKAQAPAGRYVQAAQDEALKTALDNAGFGIQLCEINPSAAVDAQADGKQEVATGTVNRQETALAVNRTAAPQREDPIGEIIRCRQCLHRKRFNRRRRQRHPAQISKRFTPPSRRKAFQTP